MVSRLGEELDDEDARLEAEGLCLAEERRKLEAAVALARHQCDLDNKEAKALLAASREARSRAVEEAREADQRLRRRRSGRGNSWPGATPWSSKWSCGRRPLRR